MRDGIENDTQKSNSKGGEGERHQPPCIKLHSLHVGWNNCGKLFVKYVGIRDW
jgi:hypothetical protein